MPYYLALKPFLNNTKWWRIIAMAGIKPPQELHHFYVAIFHLELE